MTSTSKKWLYFKEGNQKSEVRGSHLTSTISWKHYMSYLRQGAFWRLCDCSVGLTRYRGEHTECGRRCLLFPVARLVVGTGWATSLHMASPQWRWNEGEPSGQTQRQEDLEESQKSINTKRHTDTNTHNINNKHLRKLHTQTHNNPSSFSLGTWAAILAFSAPRTAASSFNIQYMHQPHKLNAITPVCFWF